MLTVCCFNATALSIPDKIHPSDVSQIRLVRKKLNVSEENLQVV